MSYQVFFNKSCKALNGRRISPDASGPSASAGEARRITAILRCAARRRHRQRQQQFFLGQLAQRHLVAVDPDELPLRIRRGRSPHRSQIQSRCRALTGNANPCMQRWQTSRGVASNRDRAPRTARGRLRKCKARLQVAQRAPPANPATEAIRARLIDTFKHRGLLGQARAIDEVWQAGCHGPRIIGPVPTPVKNESGASRCF